MIRQASARRAPCVLWLPYWRREDSRPGRSDAVRTRAGCCPAGDPVMLRVVQTRSAGGAGWAGSLAT
jgi:hypothetical protein